jgi:hypothetical protein
MADSRPGPGPFTKTSTVCMPWSMARRAAPSALICAAYGVLFRDPLNPAAPALPHAMGLPVMSVMVTSVLLNVACMWACPRGTIFRSRRRPRCGRFGAALPMYPSVSSIPPRGRYAQPSTQIVYFFDVALRRPATVFRAPRFVRAFVLVRCPRTGRFRRCRRPR